MKKYIVIVLSIFMFGNLCSQTRGISYQALIINPQDEEAPGFNGKQTPLANKEVCLRFSFLDSNDRVEYQETQKIKTDEFGMVNLFLGQGAGTGAGYVNVFNEILWDGSTKRLKVEVDVKYNCQVFEEISNQILAYVPFAFYALNSPASKIPGPKGDTGVGIKEIKNISDTLIVKLSNDSIIKLGNIKGNKGDQGIQGPIGITGNNGKDGVSITNAKVESDSLKITLSNGSVINSGYVKGNKGDTGVQGKTGSNGISVMKTDIKKDSLMIMLSDSSIQNAGYVKGNKGDTGVSGTNGISVTNSQVINDSLKVTLSNGTIINAGYVKGNTGAQGPQGIQGLTGATGPQGATGSSGSQGPAGTNGISVTNSQVVNDSLKVTLSNGTIINTGYVKGNTGAQGLQGIQGLTGPQGPTGATGSQGPAGTNGISVTNSQVVNDSLKVTLSNGTIINAGYVKGNTGAQGLQGIQGLTGPQGPTGATGSQGPAGTNGISVTNSQVVNDSLKVTLSNGTIINAGYVKGNTGATGPQGIQGLTGATGPQGPTGATGAQGPAGTNGISVTNSQVVNDSLKVTLSNGTIINAGYVKGNTGAQGPQGIQGLTGPQGPTGATGANGIQGPAGTNGISITNSQVINDSLKVTLSNGNIVNAGYVKGNIGAQGPQGIQGLTGATGSQGPQGLTGATGPQGAIGAQGTAGTNGISVTNSQVINDSLKVTLSNGNIINAGYVKGNTGAQGPQGIQGLTGAQGPQGIQGLTGPQGPTGATGANGIQGSAGTNGISITNSQVINDSLKVTLSNGNIINAGYVKGNTGAQGLQGSQGPNGINTLVKTTNEPNGANCSAGGVKLEYGLDANRNGIVDTNEINISLTKYLCNGDVSQPGVVDTVSNVFTNTTLALGLAVPGFLKFYGNGSSGNKICINNEILLTNSNFKNLTIPVGITAKINPEVTTVLYVQDTLFLYGTINGAGSNGVSSTMNSINNHIGATASGAEDNNYRWGPSGGSQSLSFSWIVANQPSSYIFSMGGNIAIPSGLSDGYCGSTNGNDLKVSDLLKVIHFGLDISGVNGAAITFISGSGSCNSFIPAYGGQGGGGLYIMARNVILNGNINLSGGNGGFAGPWGCGGTNIYYGVGAAAGGGSAVISTNKIISNNITFNGSGGSQTASFGCNKVGGKGSMLIIK